ncbi:unnamed protein product [Colias eurytheme]|nr:unnamed protein product [Colias eurytheme]
MEAAERDAALVEGGSSPGANQNIENDEADPIPVEDKEQCDDSNLGQQELFGNPNNVPSIKTASPTRWHSILIMLESLYKAKFLRTFLEAVEMLSSQKVHDEGTNPSDWVPSQSLPADYGGPGRSADCSGEPASGDSNMTALLQAAKRAVVIVDDRPAKRPCPELPTTTPKGKGVGKKTKK